MHHELALLLELEDKRLRGFVCIQLLDRHVGCPQYSLVHCGIGAVTDLWPELDALPITAGVGGVMLRARPTAWRRTFMSMVNPAAKESSDVSSVPAMEADRARTGNTTWSSNVPDSTRRACMLIFSSRLRMSGKAGRFSGSLCRRRVDAIAHHACVPRLGRTQAYGRTLQHAFISFTTGFSPCSRLEGNGSKCTGRFFCCGNTRQHSFE